MKGIYPPIVYVLLFGVGVLIFISIYSFTGEFISEKNLELENIRAEKICNFFKSLKDKEGEVSLNIQEFSVETNPLRIIGTAAHNCNMNLYTSGSCKKECKIKMVDGELIFSPYQ